MRYIYLITPLVAWLISQTLKIMFQRIEEGERKFRWDLLIRSGGMPSAHSASTASLATLVGIENGFDSALFAIAAVFTLVVMYDARGVRYASGKQASYLNLLLNLMRDEIHSDEELEVLKTEIGHSTMQVLAGLVVGITVAIVMAKIYLRD